MSELICSGRGPLPRHICARSGLAEFGCKTQRFVGLVLFLGLIVNALAPKRTMCHEMGRSFEAAQIASMLRD
jgi:hypothetical protein